MQGISPYQDIIIILILFLPYIYDNNSMLTQPIALLGVKIVVINDY